MDDFKIVIDGKEYSCVKCDRVYIEPDGSSTRSDIDYSELNNLIESFNIPIESISGTICCIKKRSPNYKRMRNFFRKLRKECSKKGSK